MKSPQVNDDLQKKSGKERSSLKSKVKFAQIQLDFQNTIFTKIRGVIAWSLPRASHIPTQF